jgi:hypothetical protein
VLTNLFERRERERGEKRERKFGGDRKSDQDLESGLVIFDEAKRAKQSLCFISMRQEQTKAMAQPMLTQMPTHAAIKQHQYQPCLIVFQHTSLTKDIAVRAKKGDMSRQRNNLWQRLRYQPV